MMTVKDRLMENDFRLAQLITESKTFTEKAYVWYCKTQCPYDKSNLSDYGC